MSTTSKYRLFCVTENANVSGWGDATPTVCYNNNTHTINENSIQVIQTVASNEVTIKEDSIIVNRNARIEGIYFTNVASYVSQEISYVFQYPTSMYSYTFSVDDTNKDDEITIAINENTTMGLITGSLSVGATVIGAPIALLLYGQVGMSLILADGTNTDDVGFILSIDQEAETVTVSIPTTHSFSSANTLVKMTYYAMRDLRLSNAGVYKWFDDVIGGSPPPIGTVVKFRYKNNATFNNIDDSPKNFTIYITMLF
jgi:hypothetical protein